MAKGAAALTFTRASLAETLAQVEELVRSFGSLSGVADRIVELEAEQQEREDELAALSQERDALRARVDALQAETSDGVSPDVLLRFLKRRVYCVGDLDRLLPLLVECQREQRRGKKAAADAEMEAPASGVLMMTLQELKPAAAPALAPLFAASSPPPSPTVAVATAPLPATAAPSTAAKSKTTPLEDVGVEKDGGDAEPQDDAETKADGDSNQQDAEAVKSNGSKSQSEDPKQETEGNDSPQEDPEDQSSDDDGERTTVRTAAPTKRRRGVPLWTKRKRGSTVPKRSPTPPAQPGVPRRRGRPPSRLNAVAKKEEPQEKPGDDEQPPNKRLRTPRDVTPRQILEWPEPPRSSNEDGRFFGNQGTSEATPAFQTLDFRVVASLEQTKPWDKMCNQRERGLRIPDLTSPTVLEWATRCLKAQYVRRQAYWERLHWLPDSSCKGVQWEKYKVARQERAALADREWKSIYAESVRLMTEDLLPEDVWCDPALWPLPEKPVLLLPKSVDLHAQIRLADTNEPIRLYFVTTLDNHPFFSEGLAAVYPAMQMAPLVGGEATDPDGGNENSKWWPEKRGKRGAKVPGTTKENGGLLKVNAAADDGSEPEAE